MSEPASHQDMADQATARSGGDEREKTDAGEQNGNQGSQDQSSDRSLAEWTTFGVSTAIVLGLLILLLSQAWLTGKDPVSITAQWEATGIRRERTGYYVPLQVANSGDEAAEDVWVRVVLEPDQGPAEAATINVGFLAGHGEEKAGAIFQSDPTRGTLRVAGIGYLRP